MRVGIETSKRRNQTDDYQDERDKGDRNEEVPEAHPPER
jgi:hypothetical protein